MTSHVNVRNWRLNTRILYWELIKRIPFIIIVWLPTGVALQSTGVMNGTNVFVAFKNDNWRANVNQKWIQIPDWIDHNLVTMWQVVFRKNLVFSCLFLAEWIKLFVHHPSSILLIHLIINLNGKWIHSTVLCIVHLSFSFFYCLNCSDSSGRVPVV